MNLDLDFHCDFDFYLDAELDFDIPFNSNIWSKLVQICCMSLSLFVSLIIYWNYAITIISLCLDELPLRNALDIFLECLHISSYIFFISYVSVSLFVAYLLTEIRLSQVLDAMFFFWNWMFCHWSFCAVNFFHLVLNNFKLPPIGYWNFNDWVK